MMRTIMLAVAITTGAATAARSQAVATSAVADTAAKALLGTWEGPYESDHAPPGTIRIVVAHDSTWTVTATMFMQGQELGGAGENVVVKGNNASWTQALMGMSCNGRAVVSSATLRGETSCGDGGISYVLKKK